MNYKSTGPVFVWLERASPYDSWEVSQWWVMDPEDALWTKDEVREGILVECITSTLEDNEIPPSCLDMLVKGYIFFEESHSPDYGIDYDGGFEVDSIDFLYTEHTELPETEDQDQGGDDNICFQMHKPRSVPRMKCPSCGTEDRNGLLLWVKCNGCSETYNTETGEVYDEQD